jgi:signal transduction histidine kinase/CheY-like chemotaxis protein
VARHGIALLVALIMLAASVAGGYVAQRVNHDQERRMLDQRTTELAEFLASSLTAIRAPLIAVGTIAVAEPGHSATLSKVAASIVSPGSGVVVWQQAAGGFDQLDSVGAAPPGQLATQQQNLARRAVAAADMVTDLVGRQGATRYLLVALKVPATTPTAVVWAAPIAASQPAPTSSNSPYRDLNVAVYASSAASPATLLLTSGHTPGSGSGTVRQAVPVGSDTWLLVTAARQPLVGSFAADAPLGIVLGGVLLAIVIAALVDVLIRRRDYAANLVQQRTNTLQQAQASAEQANQAKSEFLSRMSHELRTPLNAVLGFSQLLEMDELTADQQESVGQITKGGRHLLDLINEVLDISHIEAGKLSQSPEAVLVGDLIRETVDLMRPLADDRAIHLLGPDQNGCEKFIFADRQRVKQILLNLISNAIKYNRHGGSVSINCAAASQGQLRIQVVDTGPGIPEHQIPLLFIPFERLGAEQTTVEGTGIGLALSHKLAEALGGRLGVDTTVGQGSTFWIEFPIVEGPVDRYERLHAKAEPPVVDNQRELVKILYIEDNLSNLKLVERILRQRPHVELISAMQGQLGLELAREHHPVLVLLDLNLADLRGDEVLRRLSEHPDTAHIPVVIVSADAIPRNMQRLLSAGASGYLTKPINVAQMLKVVDDALEAQPVDVP